MARLFGTDGVRGIANEKLTAQLAFRLGFAGALVLTGNGSHAVKPVFLIGNDTRASAGMLEAALSAGITSAGCDVISVGVLPTPGVAYLTSLYGCGAGVMISASHNSYEYNGIKFFSSEGFKLPDEVEDEIEKVISNFEDYYKNLPGGNCVGKVFERKDAVTDYADYLGRCVDCDLSGYKIAIDCANGASSVIAESVFSKKGATCVMTGNKPDGTNINDGCGSTHLENLSRLVVSESCDMGFAFDGDADRFLAADNLGNTVDGDVIMSIIALAMKKKGILKNDTLVVTVMSNLGVSIMAKREGLDLAKTKVGDRYVLERMRAEGYNLGGEQSGHVILLDHATTGDGMLTALTLSKALIDDGQTLNEASGCVTVLPQVLRSARICEASKERILNSEVLADAIEQFERELGEDGRILVRASGTEPIIRVMLEGRDIDRIGEMAESLVSVVEGLNV